MGDGIDYVGALGYHSQTRSNVMCRVCQDQLQIQHNRLETNNKLEQIVYQAKLNSYWRQPFWKSGFFVPSTHCPAVEIDLANGDTKWQYSEGVEMEQLLE
jgi:hypothetical protein